MQAALDSLRQVMWCDVVSCGWVGSLSRNKCIIMAHVMTHTSSVVCMYTPPLYVCIPPMQAEWSNKPLARPPCAKLLGDLDTLRIARIGTWKHRSLDIPVQPRLGDRSGVIVTPLAPKSCHKCLWKGVGQLKNIGAMGTGFCCRRPFQSRILADNMRLTNATLCCRRLLAQGLAS